MQAALHTSVRRISAAIQSSGLTHELSGALRGDAGALASAQLGWARWFQSSNGARDNAWPTASPASSPGPGKLPGVAVQPGYESGREQGIVHVNTTKNNTILTLTDLYGSTKCAASAGTAGNKGARRKGAVAAGDAAVQLAQRAIGLGFKNVAVRIKGIGAAREVAIRSLQATGLKVTRIDDTTALPHNGCRPPARRRL
ncbi:unnamed protein product [Pedinophyceae sp. YPF-701]|nr:unnamed protein product [Pedinophyceae sp. YPF-701]